MYWTGRQLRVRLPALPSLQGGDLRGVIYISSLAHINCHSTHAARVHQAGEHPTITMAGERSSVPAPARPAPPVPGGHREHSASQSSGHHHGRGRERGTASSAAQQRGPQQIGDYDLVKTLGTGSFGKVKRECPVIREDKRRGRASWRMKSSSSVAVGRYGTKQSTYTLC
jgi:hypothetical protein